MNTRRLLAVAVLGLAAAAWADWPAEELWYKCKGCHGMDGKANTKVGAQEKVADFTTTAWQESRSDAKIREIISDGSPKKGSKMKAYREKFTAAEIDSLVPYIRAMKEK